MVVVAEEEAKVDGRRRRKERGKCDFRKDHIMPTTHCTMSIRKRIDGNHVSFAFCAYRAVGTLMMFSLLHQ